MTERSLLLCMTSLGLNDLLHSAWHQFIEILKVGMVYSCPRAPADSIDSLIANKTPPASPQTPPAGPQILLAGPQTPLAGPHTPLDKRMDGQTDEVKGE